MTWTTDMRDPFRPAADIGPRPELAWLPVDALISDPSYQRTADTLRSGRLIREIAESFNWRRFKAPTVAPAGEGRYAIIDGQHTVAAARLHGGIAELPCLIVEGDAAQQADGFVHCNANRLAVNAFQLFHARLAAGEPDALQVKHICDAANVEIPRYPIPATSMKPRQTLAVQAIDAAMRKYGDGPCVFALRIIADAAGDHGGQLRAALIRAVVNLHLAAKGKVEIDAKRLQAVLAERMAEEWIDLARGDRKLNKRGTEENIQARLTAAYNNRLSEERRLPLPF